MSEISLEEIRKLIQELKKEKSFLLWTPKQHEKLLESVSGKKDGKWK